MKKKEKIKFEKDIDKINFPILSDIDGESWKEINKLIERGGLPKFKKIGFNREIFYHKKYGYDLTKVYIIK